MGPIRATAAGDLSQGPQGCPRVVYTCRPLVVVPGLIWAHWWEGVTARLPVFKAQQELRWAGSQAGLGLEHDSLWGSGYCQCQDCFPGVVGAPVSAEATHWGWQGGSNMGGSKPDIMCNSRCSSPGLGCLTWDSTSSLAREDLCLFCFPS